MILSDKLVYKLCVYKVKDDLDIFNSLGRKSKSNSNSKNGY